MKKGSQTELLIKGSVESTPKYSKTSSGKIKVNGREYHDIEPSDRTILASSKTAIEQY